MNYVCLSFTDSIDGVTRAHKVVVTLSTAI